jgi:hypothetical protein
MKPVFLLVALGGVMLCLGLHDSLDAHFYYSATEADTYFSSLSPRLRHLYLKTELIDLAFLTTYSWIFWTLAGRYFSRSYRWMAFVPGIFDLIETSSIILILSGWPVENFSAWLGVATMIKWTTGTVFVCKAIYHARIGPLSC